MDSGQLEDRWKKSEGGKMDDGGKEMPQREEKKCHRGKKRLYISRRRNEGGVGLRTPEVEVTKKQNLKNHS
jgi:hypothetical protein